MIKNLPANAGAAGSIPGSGRFPWRKKNATHSSILARIIPWTEEPDGLTVHGVSKSGTRLSDLITHACSLGGGHRQSGGHAP